MVSFESKSYSKRLLHLISWSHWFTFFNVFLAILLSSFYVFGEKTPDTMIGHLYLYTTWASHMGFLTFMGFVLIIFPIILIYPKTQFIRVTSSLIFTGALFLLLLDAFVFLRLGYHLNASSSDQIILLISNMIAHNSLKFWVISGSVALLLLSIELTLSNYAWKHLKELQRVPYAKYVVHVLVASFFISHFTHIWADAKWNYDVLKQDTVLPLSYPSTAKTLLTKYELFDAENYVENKESALSLKHQVSEYPRLTQQCIVNEKPKQSVFMVLTQSMLTDNQIAGFSLKSISSNVNLTRHIDNALPVNSWFNLFYSLPTIYKNDILSQNIKPLLFQEMERRGLSSDLTLVSNSPSTIDTLWFKEWFDNAYELTGVSSLIFSSNKKSFTEKLNQLNAGLHVFYFDDESTAQAELFIDALLLSQRQKNTKDIVFVSSIGNKNIQDSLSIKPSLLVIPERNSDKLKRLTSHMDIQPTLLSEWLSCKASAQKIVNGQNILTVKSNRVIANTIDSGIIVFNKDKSVFIDKNGEFQSYSRQLQTPISVNADFPLMIDGVNFIKRFNKPLAETD
ncbi:DUF3413 domain-containing protein [Colwellia sp. UCD-KL20]|uniref:DUF3413 domain-containing protein n=1 Tax=Colwellia sp. UCD-KL20 TaxID=1917165 RepID=UPI0009706CAA|nr:DUF3413 domain-containing protein [Colwellia sp. UCD-KL20]